MIGDRPPAHRDLGPARLQLEVAIEGTAATLPLWRVRRVEQQVAQLVDDVTRDRLYRGAVDLQDVREAIATVDTARLAGVA